ncbi:membrane protease subunit (stomatin/prohibitin family) [Nocardiopsis mwathae]|uniref:Membrane protease subunit (Stomatin/prohibitin family) n=1 Tax=Nocardiopsis mwathae TaxID=1472723 RepID=A0A7W9YMD5_9ACTN|nr:membrane protease subunit (stomatin/prohibitin family) [Nocardiopsis mwathae]
MGLFDAIRGELVDIIEWLDDSRDTIVWRFPRHDNEIKMGAQLIVRESQVAVFVNEGRLADVYPPGTYTLHTQNMPVLSTLKGWKYGFESPFKAEVYFVNTRLFTDMKWGTQNPVMLRDPEFGPVRVRAFGGYAVRVLDPARLIGELAGTDPQFRTEEVEEYLRQMIVGRLAGALATATADVPVLELAAKQHEIGERLAELLSVDLADVGLEIPRFIVENISLPKEVEEALDKRSQMGILGDLGEYTRFQAANALEDAAQNPGGGASEGMGLGMGIAAGQQMASALGGGAPQAPAPQHGGPQHPGHPAPYQGQQPAQPAQPAHPAPAPQHGGPAAPPPLPPQEQWYIGANGQQLGPFGPADLSAQVGSGALRPDTLVWKTGMQQWVPAGQLPELARLFGPTPPPLPPSH